MKTSFIFTTLISTQDSTWPILSEAESQVLKAQDSRCWYSPLPLWASTRRKLCWFQGKILYCYPQNQECWYFKSRQWRVRNINLWDYLLMCNPRDRNTFPPRRRKWFYLAARGMDRYFLKQNKTEFTGKPQCNCLVKCKQSGHRFFMEHFWLHSQTKFGLWS